MRAIWARFCIDLTTVHFAENRKPSLTPAKHSAPAGDLNSVFHWSKRFMVPDTFALFDCSLPQRMCGSLVFLYLDALKF